MSLSGLNSSPQQAQLFPQMSTAEAPNWTLIGSFCDIGSILAPPVARIKLKHTHVTPEVSTAAEPAVSGLLLLPVKPQVALDCWLHTSFHVSGAAEEQSHSAAPLGLPVQARQCGAGQRPTSCPDLRLRALHQDRRPPATPTPPPAH